MRKSDELDVLIVGAGPAGAHTALRLARLGRRVGLLDRRTFPRPKPCGEFLSPAALPMLEELDLLEPLRELGAVAVSGMRMVGGTGDARGRYGRVGSWTPRHGHGLGIRREVLDEVAVRAAAAHPNVTALLGWSGSRALLDADGRVRGLRATDPGGRPVELGARFLVAADGMRSRIARGLGLAAESRAPRRFAIVARFRTPAADEAQLHVVGRDYFAVCPIDGGITTANLVVDADDMPSGSSRIDELFRGRLRGAPVLAEQLSVASLSEPMSVCGPLGSSVRAATAPGVALVGDAAGFVDPLTGEGMFLAMQGAALLAPRLDAALRDPRRERRELRAYERARARCIAPRHMVARLLQRGLRRPGTPERVLEWLARAPGARDLVLGLTGDYVPPWALLSPRVWAGALLAR